MARKHISRAEMLQRVARILGGTDAGRVMYEKGR